MPNYAVVLCLCGLCLEQADTAANKDEHVLLTLFQISDSSTSLYLYDPALVTTFCMHSFIYFFPKTACGDQ
jgi:hypothetical protein